MDYKMRKKNVVPVIISNKTCRHFIEKKNIPYIFFFDIMYIFMRGLKPTFNKGRNFV